MELFSPVLKPGGLLLKQYTCVGVGESPPLRWRDLPEGTQALALVCEGPDEDGRPATHWLLADVPADQDDVPQGLDPQTFFRGGALVPVEGTNDLGSLGYAAPCPPPGGEHRFTFRLLALDGALGLEPGFSRDGLEAAAAGRVLGQAELAVTFARTGREALG